MAIIQARKNEFSLPPNGLYPAVIEKITDRNTSYGTALNFQFKTLVDVGDYKAGRMLFGMVSPIVTPKSKLHKWLLALGITLKVGDPDLDPATLIGRKVIASVVLNQAGTFANVVDLHPYNEALFPATPAQVAPVAQVKPVATPVQQEVKPVVPISVPLPIPTITDLGSVSDDDQLF